jgi:hypothetical protein
MAGFVTQMRQWYELHHPGEYEVGHADTATQDSIPAGGTESLLDVDMALQLVAASLRPVVDLLERDRLIQPDCHSKTR